MFKFIRMSSSQSPPHTDGCSPPQLQPLTSHWKCDMCPTSSVSSEIKSRDQLRFPPHFVAVEQLNLKIINSTGRSLISNKQGFETGRLGQSIQRHSEAATKDLS